VAQCEAVTFFKDSPAPVDWRRAVLVRNGWSCQVPARRAVGRDNEAVAGWVRYGPARKVRGALGAWLVFEHKPDSP
jgi:hypothetical protein